MVVASIFSQRQANWKGVVSASVQMTSQHMELVNDSLHVDLPASMLSLDHGAF